MRTGTLSVAVTIAAAATSAAQGIVIELDYSYDSAGFFSGNQQAKDALEAAANELSSYITDTLSTIDVPEPYASEVGDGTAVWEWDAVFTHPGNGSAVELLNPTIAADAYVIYAGARSLTGDTLGQGGAGGYNRRFLPTGGFLQSEIDEMDAITDAFFETVETRDHSGFSSWGGSITFDNDGSTSWWYDHLSDPAGGLSDFYSVALHELVHALGFGGEDWEAMVSGGAFHGAASSALYGGPVPVSDDDSHWLEFTESDTFIGGLPQETAMDPDITDGERKFLTELDAAGLTDLGWTLVPEPASVVAMLVGGAVLAGRRRRGGY